jgi:cell division protein FtsB
MKANIDQLQREVAELKETVAKLRQELGVSG